MPDEVVQNPSAAAADGKPVADATADRLKALEREITERDNRIKELTDSERHWATLARGGGKQEKPPAEEVDFDLVDGLVGEAAGADGEDTAEALIEDLSKNGIKALQKRGFLTRSEAERLAAETSAKVSTRAVNKAVTRILEDQAIANAYPGLNDESSEMFKLTAEAMKMLTGGDPAAARDRKILKAAAEIAKAKMAAASAARPARREAVDAQMGDMTGFGGGFQEDADDDLSPVQRSIIAKFNSDGIDTVSEDGYRKRADQVRMGRIPAGMMRRRA